MKINKLLLSIGTVAAIAAPVISTVSCGGTKLPVAPPSQIPPSQIPPSQTPPSQIPPSQTPPLQTPLVEGIPWTAIELMPMIPPTDVPPVTDPQSKNYGTQPLIDPGNQLPKENPHASKIDTVNLEDGIFDYTNDSPFSKEELNDIFNNKFTEDINFGANAGIYGGLGALNKPTIDATKMRKKVMLIGTPNGNNGSYIILAGVIGYKIEANGDKTNEVIFKFADYDDASKIADDSKAGSEKNIVLSGPVDPVKMFTVFALSVPEFSGEKIADDLISFAKPIFTDSKWS